MTQISPSDRLAELYDELDHLEDARDRGYAVTCKDIADVRKLIQELEMIEWNL